MKKYTPSVKNNNAVKGELCSEMKGLLYLSLIHISEPTRPPCISYSVF